MVFLPQVVRATHDKGFRIRITFNDGTEASVDFESLTGPVFEPLKRAAYFRKFFVDGGTVVWPNGADIILPRKPCTKRPCPAGGAGETMSAAAQRER